MAAFTISISGNKELQAALKKVSDPEMFADSVFIQVSNTAIRNLVAGSQGKGRIKTGNTARAWKREKLAASKYALTNDSATLDGKHLIANILNYGHKEIKPTKAKALYIPLTEKGVNRGTGYKKGLEYGVDFVMAKRVKPTTPGSQFMEKEKDRATNELVSKLLVKIRDAFR